MADGPEFAQILRGKGPDALVLLVTVLLTVFVDLMFGILCGCALAFALSRLLRSDSRTPQA